MINAAGLPARLPMRGAIPAFRSQRHFSSARPALKEIQDAYILSASRTPTAKVRKILDDMELATAAPSASSHTNPYLRLLVQRLVRLRLGSRTWCGRHQIRPEQVQAPR